MNDDDYDKVPCRYCGGMVIELLLAMHETVCTSNPTIKEPQE